MQTADQHTNHDLKFLALQAGKETPHRFEHKAMNTTYEIYIMHDDKVYAGQAANAAFNEIDRLELELSRFKENSDVSRINALKQFDTITLGTDCYSCLEQCSELYQQTRGVFDISAGFIVDLWKKTDAPASWPDNEKIQTTLPFTGMPWLHLLDNFQVCLMAPKISIDLGGYGKGYALRIVSELLSDWGISKGILNAGMSSMMPLGESEWPIEIRHPQHSEHALKQFILSQKTISGSGKRKGQHIIDPRNGYPVKDRIAAWAVADDPGISDALSTAFMIMSIPEVEAFCEIHGVGALLITETGKTVQAGLI